MIVIEIVIEILIIIVIVIEIVIEIVIVIVIGPGPRAQHDAFVLRPGHFVVHGGVSGVHGGAFVPGAGSRDNRTFVLGLDTAAPRWEEVTPGAAPERRPTSRIHHSATTLGDGRAALLLGGHDWAMLPIGDAAVLEAPEVSGLGGGGWEWWLAPSEHQRPRPGRRLPGGGVKRAFHTATAVGAGRLVAVFGGLAAGPGLDGPSSDLVMLDLAPGARAEWEVPTAGSSKQ